MNKDLQTMMTPNPDCSFSITEARTAFKAFRCIYEGDLKKTAPEIKVEFGYATRLTNALASIIDGVVVSDSLGEILTVYPSKVDIVFSGSMFYVATLYDHRDLIIAQYSNIDAERIGFAEMMRFTVRFIEEMYFNYHNEG